MRSMTTHSKSSKSLQPTIHAVTADLLRDSRLGEIETPSPANAVACRKQNPNHNHGCMWRSIGDATRAIFFDCRTDIPSSSRQGQDVVRCLRLCVCPERKIDDTLARGALLVPTSDACPSRLTLHSIVLLETLPISTQTALFINDRRLMALCSAIHCKCTSRLESIPDR